MCSFLKLDAGNGAKLNVSKPRDDKVPYSDGLAPFPVPQPPPADPAPVEWYVGHDLYSLAVVE